jgi:superfamily II DNA or RNA helicase
MEASAQPQLLARMCFGHSWRDYQQRALDEAESHLADQRLHVVAAPGSGKTVLGLEIVRRLGARALVFAPTRTVRDQWPDRLCALFLSAPLRPGEVSSELDLLGDLTVSTYQSLHSLWADEDQSRFERLTRELREGGSLTVVLDEAHHLRRAWWNALQALLEALPKAHIVPLTATPPYDAGAAEWERYQALCGPADLEIAVPELVRSQDLCPHQDHIIFSEPDGQALDHLERRREAVAAIQSGLRGDRDLLDQLARHAWLTDPGAQVEPILESPEMLSAVLVLLASAGRKLPAPPLALLGIGRNAVQLPSLFWLEVLLNGLVFKHRETFDVGKTRRERLKSDLHSHGLIEGGEVRLRESRSIATLMSGNLAKLDSIAAIAAAEADNLGAALRMVILTDHVRAGELTKVGAGNHKPTRMGVIPIFHTLCQRGLAGRYLGVLTGSLVIVPKTAEQALRLLAAARGCAPGDVAVDTLQPCPDYLRVTVADRSPASAVQLVTALFTAGSIDVLVGTQALLGEGWDAPAVNSLVLASNSSAFMLSNQMRGRAIRKDPGTAQKVSNIWHLATVENEAGGLVENLAEAANWGDLNEEGPATADFKLLARRFRAFEGVYNGGSARIESGHARLGLDESLSLPERNQRTFGFAADRSSIAAAWKRSIEDASPGAKMRRVAAPAYAPRSLSWHDTLRWLSVSGLGSAMAGAGAQLRNVDGMAGAGSVGLVLGSAAVLASAPKLIKAGWLLWRNGSLEKSLSQVGSVILAAFRGAELITDADLKSARIEVRRAISGRCDVTVLGVSRSVERSIIEAFAELLGPVGNARYLLVRHSWLGSRRRTDYHAVPAVLAARKAWAELFWREWKSAIGSSRLVYTRTPDGRVALLRARARSFAAGYRRHVQDRSAWM